MCSIHVHIFVIINVQIIYTHTVLNVYVLLTKLPFTPFHVHGDINYIYSHLVLPDMSIIRTNISLVTILT